MSTPPAATQEDEQQLATVNRLALQNNSQVLSRLYDSASVQLKRLSAAALSIDRWKAFRCCLSSLEEQCDLRNAKEKALVAAVYFAPFSWVD